MGWQEDLAGLLGEIAPTLDWAEPLPRVLGAVPDPARAAQVGTVANAAAKIINPPPYLTWPTKKIVKTVASGQPGDLLAPDPDLTPEVPHVSVMDLLGLVRH
jgi:hypothetical protein